MCLPSAICRSRLTCITFPFSSRTRVSRRMPTLLLSHHLDRAIDFHGHNLRFSANKRPHSVNASRHGFHCVFLSEFQRLGVLSEPGHSADCKRVICLGDVQNVHQFVRRLRCQIGKTLGVSTALFVSKAYESAQIRKKGLGAVGIKLPRPIQID